MYFFGKMGAVSLTLNFLRFGALLGSKMGEYPCSQSRSSAISSRPT
jgi:hypothetical protein